MNGHHPGRPQGGEGVAIVGMSCIFPGAPDLQTYWRNIVGKVDALSEPPEDWGADVFYDPAASENDRIYCKRGGFLHELASFDPLEYGVMPTSIDGGEPDHFLALRVAHEALSDAGFRSGESAIPGERVEVILGRGAYINRGFTNLVQHGLVVDQTLRLLRQLHPEHTEAELAELRRELKSALPSFNPEIAPGLVPNILSGRIANRLDLMGPNFTIDAACASSLIAVERAIQDLESHRCDMALTGGIHCSSPPPIFMVFCQLNALSRSGKLRPFSEDADGTLLGEGLGMIVLKRKADAMRDGDRIYAVIRAVGSASDGRALGLLAPRLEGEELAMRRAYEWSGISPASIGLLEAHGTGTPVGDLTEAQALARIFGTRDGRPPSCALGSVKSMISHLIPAAGIAGIIKMALALYYKVLPPTLHSERPNPKLGLDQTPLYINSETRPWIHGLATPRRAGVNAFGFGGINAHAILEEAASEGTVFEAAAAPRWDSEVFLLRGVSRADLLNACRRFEHRIAGLQEASLPDLAYGLNCGQESAVASGDCLGIVAGSIDDLKRKLVHAAARLEDPACHSIRDASGIYFFERQLARQGKVAFVFPGEGSQYLNMLAGLCLRLPVVRERFDLIDRAFSGHARGWLPSQVIFPPPLPCDAQTRLDQERRLQAMDFASEAVFAANQALFALLRDLGIAPDMLAGHSGGEVSALLAGGVIQTTSDLDLVHHITEMNRLYTRILSDGVVPRGCVVAVSGLGRDVVLEAVRESGLHFEIGMDNCPHQVVLCGSEPSADELSQRLRGLGGICTPLPFQRPYHTPAFEVYCDSVRPFFERLRIAPARVPVYCAAVARPFPADPEEIRRLAANQTALPVRFRETIQAMYDDGARIFVEVGPRGTLTSFVNDTLRERPHLAIACDVANLSGVQQLSNLLAHLAAHGVAMRLDSLYRGRARRWDDNAPASSRNGARGIRLVTGLAQMRLKETRPVKSPSPAVPTAPDNPRRELPGSVSPMHAYLDSMDRFLTVQHEVMQAYLRSTSAAGPAPPDPVALNGAGLSQKPPSSAQPAAILDEAPVRNGNQQHAGALATLLEVISDRTGYPTDMLEPHLNLEADLGIDSIKRIEILGALHARTELIGPGKMERASSLKTIAEILQFLDSAAVPASAKPPAPSVFPFAGRIELAENGEQLISVRDIDISHDLFLRDHALGGRVSARDPELPGLPVIPLTMTLEMMAEAASQLFPGLTLIEMRDIRAFQWIAVDLGRLTLRTVAKMRRESPAEARVEMRDQEDNLVAEAAAIFGAGHPPAPEPISPTLRAERPSQWTPERLYRDHMFHGPSFRGIESIDRWGENGLTATLVGLPTDGLFRGLSAPVFLTDPVLLDAAGQMVGYWAAEHLATAFNVFPYRIQSVQWFAGALEEGRRAQCFASIRAAGDSQLHADLEIVTSGRLRMRVSGWEDLRVDLPDNFYRACISPRSVSLSSAHGTGPDAALCSLNLSTLPSLSAQGGIWLRVLAHLILGPRERDRWHVFDPSDPDRIAWLLQRCCAKDAVRKLVAPEQELLPADVEFADGEDGRLVAAGGALRPVIAITHARDIAVAAASLDSSATIGLEVQSIPGRVAPGSRLSCARQAAAKAFPVGAGIESDHWRVTGLDARDGVQVFDAAGRTVQVATHHDGNFMIAACFYRTSEESHELSTPGTQRA